MAKVKKTRKKTKSNKQNTTKPKIPTKAKECLYNACNSTYMHRIVHKQHLLTTYTFELQPTVEELLNTKCGYIPRYFDGDVYACIPVFKSLYKQKMVTYNCPFCIDTSLRCRDKKVMHCQNIPLEHSTIYNMGPYEFQCPRKNFAYMKFKGVWLFCVNNKDDDEHIKALEEKYKNKPYKPVPPREKNQEKIKSEISKILVDHEN